MTAPSESRAVKVGYVLLNLFLAGAIAFAAFEIVNPVVGAARGGRMLVGATVPAKLQLSPDRVRLPRGVRRDDWLTATVQVRHPTAAQEALSAGMALTQLALLMAVLWLLRGIVRSVRL